MIGDSSYSQAGWIYVMALCLHKRQRNHPGIHQSVQWLKAHGFWKQARNLSELIEVSEAGATHA